MNIVWSNSKPGYCSIGRSTHYNCHKSNILIKTIVFHLFHTHSHQPPFCWWQFEGVIDMSGQPLLKGGHPECFTYDWIDMPRQGLIHL